MTHEEKWNKMYFKALEYYEEHGDLNIPINYVTEKEEIKLGSWISNQRTSYKKHKLSKEKIEKLEQIGMLWKNLENNYKFYKSKWNEMYSLAQEYYNDHGNLNIPTNYVTEKEGIKLGRWIFIQRQNYKKGSLSEEKIDALDNIDMKWKTANKRGFQPNEEKWAKMYLLAQEYYNQHNNLDVPIDYVTEKEGIKLGRWVSNQRRSYKKGALSKERIDALNKLNIKWVAKDNSFKRQNEKFKLKWNEMYNLAQKYYEKHKNLNIPKNYKTAAGEKLGQWISVQRTFYKNNCLSMERIEALESIGMIWSASKNRGFKLDEEKWNRMYAKALEYYEDHGNLNILTSYKTIDGEKLGRWITIQRQNYKKGSLSEEKIKKLESIGMKWIAKDNRIAKVDEEKWNEIYAKALEYYEEHGNLNIPQSYITKEGIKLGNWISRQRVSYKNNSLSKERIKKLESIEMKWVALDNNGRNPNEDLWNEMYKLALGYYQKHGHLNISQSSKLENAELKLGVWISRQRVCYKKGSLSEEKIEKLESIGMIWSIRGNKNTYDNIKTICNTYNIDFNKNKGILEHISINELLAKIDFLKSHNIPIVVNEKLNAIFNMSSINMKNTYGYSLEELMQVYLNDGIESKDNNVYKKVRK